MSKKEVQKEASFYAALENQAKERIPFHENMIKLHGEHIIWLQGVLAVIIEMPDKRIEEIIYCAECYYF